MCEFCLDPTQVRTDQGFNLFDPVLALDRAIAAGTHTRKKPTGKGSSEATGEEGDSDGTYRLL